MGWLGMEEWPCLSYRDCHRVFWCAGGSRAGAGDCIPGAIPSPAVVRGLCFRHHIASITSGYIISLWYWSEATAVASSCQTQAWLRKPFNWNRNWKIQRGCKKLPRSYYSPGANPTHSKHEGHCACTAMPLLPHLHMDGAQGTTGKCSHRKVFLFFCSCVL